jgi:hypothetical protein
MNRKSKKHQNETTTLTKLEAARADLDRIKVDLEKNASRQKEIRKLRAERSRRENDTVARAQSYLDSGETTGLGDQASEKEELEKLRDSEQVLREAFRIQSTSVDELVVTASREKKEELHSAFMVCLEKKFNALKNYKDAWDDEEQLRAVFVESGLRDVLPYINWPGVKIKEFDRQKGLVKYQLEQCGIDSDVLENRNKSIFYEEKNGKNNQIPAYKRSFERI